MKKRGFSFVLVASACLLSVATVEAQTNFRHHGALCEMVSGQSHAMHDYLYYDILGVANDSDTYNLTVICPLVVEANVDYEDAYTDVRVDCKDGNPTAGRYITAYLYAKSADDWSWTSCGSDTSVDGSDHLNLNFCIDNDALDDYYAVRVTIPPKYNGDHSHVYGYTMSQGVGK